MILRRFEEHLGLDFQQIRRTFHTKECFCPSDLKKIRGSNFQQIRRTFHTKECFCPSDLNVKWRFLRVCRRYM